MTNLALAFTDIRDGTVSGAVQLEGLFSRFHTVRFYLRTQLSHCIILPSCAILLHSTSVVEYSIENESPTLPLPICSEKCLQEIR